MSDKPKFEPRIIPGEPMEVFRGMSYGHTFPKATYSPWFDADDFMSVFRVVQDHTLVDMYRLYELWTLLESLRGMAGDVVEVGVWRGGSGCLMARKELLLGTQAQVYLCDTFAGVVKASDADSHYEGGEHGDTDDSIVRRLAATLQVDNVRILKGIFPEDTGDQLGAGPVKLLHIDVDVFESARDVLDALWSRIPSRGIVVFDDYGFYQCNGITRYVNQLRQDLSATFLHNLNGHAILIKN